MGGGKGCGVVADEFVPAGTTIAVDRGVALTFVGKEEVRGLFMYKKTLLTPQSQEIYKQLMSATSISPRVLYAISHLKGNTARDPNAPAPQPSDLWGMPEGHMKPFLVSGRDRLLNPPNPAMLVEIVLTNIFGTGSNGTLCPCEELRDGSILLPVCSMFNTAVETNVTIVITRDGMAVMRVVCDISPGVELTASYIPIEKLLMEEQPLENWGVTLERPPEVLTLIRAMQANPSFFTSQEDEATIWSTIEALRGERASALSYIVRMMEQAAAAAAAFAQDVKERRRQLRYATLVERFLRKISEIAGNDMQALNLLWGDLFMPRKFPRAALQLHAPELFVKVLKLETVLYD